MIALCFSLLASTLPQCQVWTSSAHITDMILAEDGRIVASSMGGVVFVTAAGEVSKLTTADGLPSNEIQALRVTHGQVVAVTPRGDFQLSIPANRTTQVKGRTVFLSDNKLPEIPLVPGDILISAIGGSSPLAVSLMGGVWAYQEKKWTKVTMPNLTSTATSIIRRGDEIWVGTTSGGLQRTKGAESFEPVQVPGDLPGSGNISCLFPIRLSSDMDLPTFSSRWMQGTNDDLYSHDPIVEAVFVSLNSQILRTGDGRCGFLNSSRVIKSLDIPRKQATAIAFHSGVIFVAQWGGWSELTGGKRTDRFSIAELQGVQITALAADDEFLYVGTQGKGLGVFNRDTLRFSWLDHGQKLGDDWVKKLLIVDEILYVGTFISGLSTYSHADIKRVSGMDGEEVTSLCLGNGKVFCGTRHGVYHVRELEAERIQARGLESEVQTLLWQDGALWVGGRTSLCRVRVD